MPCIGAHVSDCPNHVTGLIIPFETRGIAALFGTFGYELDITRISDDERAQIPEQIAWYKAYHSLIRKGEYSRITSYRENYLYDCIEVVSQDGEEALVAYVQVLAQANKKAGLSGLKVFLKMQFTKWKDDVTGEVRLCMQEF